MANSILSSAAFSTANMKPVADEQIDALWGDNISDNSGFLFYEKKMGPSFVSFNGGFNGGFPSPGTLYFTNYARYGTFSGSFNLWAAVLTGAGDTGTFIASFYVNGVLVKGTSLKMGVAGASFLKGSFSYDTTGLTNSTDYEFSWSLGQDTASGSITNNKCSVTTWQHRI